MVFYAWLKSFYIMETKLGPIFFSENLLFLRYKAVQSNCGEHLNKYIFSSLSINSYVQDLLNIINNHFENDHLPSVS